MKELTRMLGTVIVVGVLFSAACSSSEHKSSAQVSEETVAPTYVLYFQAPTGKTIAAARLFITELKNENALSEAEASVVMLPTKASGEIQQKLAEMLGSATRRKISVRTTRQEAIAKGPHVVIDFMPGMADNNIFADLHWKGTNELAGDWSYSTFAGGFKGGTVAMHKSPSK
jgi:hypothetical protein